ncbi:hypothetical protein MK139_08925 [bacterium]|nr:hypothetical protein [bacterium]
MLGVMTWWADSTEGAIRVSGEDLVSSLEGRPDSESRDVERCWAQHGLVVFHARRALAASCTDILYMRFRMASREPVLFDVKGLGQL